MAIKKYYIWIGLIAAFILRIGFSSTTDILAFGDTGDYNTAAIQIVQTCTYPLKGDLVFFRPPLYPLFLAILYKISFQNFLLVKIVQAVINVLTCFFIMRIAQKIFDKRTGYIAFMLAAINPFFIYWTGFLQTETLFMFLFIASIFSLVLFDRTDLKRYLILSAFLLALSALTRPVAVLFVPFLIIYLFIRIRKGYRSCIKDAAIFTLCFMCIIAPWTIRNYKVYKEFILINNSGGGNFFAGNNPVLVKILSSKTKQEYKQHTKEFLEWADNLLNEVKNFSNRDMQNRYFKIAFDFIRENPKTWIWLRWKNFLELWRPYVNPFVYSKNMVILSFVYLFPIIFLGLFEVIRQSLIKEIRFPDIFLVFIVLAVGTSQFLITETMIRYRIPIIDPFLIIFSSHVFCFLSYTRLDFFLRRVLYRRHR